MTRLILNSKYKICGQVLNRWPWLGTVIWQDINPAVHEENVRVL